MLKLRGKHSVPKFAILPHLMALVMLIIAGGAFTHTDMLPHFHDTESNSISSSVASHDHADASSSNIVAEIVMLHCGSNILALEAVSYPEQLCNKQLHDSERPADLTGRLLFYDPPPPRQNS